MPFPYSSTTNETLRNQWVTPGDIFSVLLILGGDVIQLALASISGRRFTPLSFSFGWVAYALSAVLGTIGDHRLIRCAPELSLLTFNLKSGYARNNKSWILSRLLKNYSFWMPEEVKFKARDWPLCVAIYDWSSDAQGGAYISIRDWLWWSGIVVTAFQLGVSLVPFGLEGDWAIFVVTAAGNALAYASASLPQWREEKWHARSLKEANAVAVTQGNGSQHVVIIRGRKGTPDLEDLATGRAPDWRSTKVATSVLAVLWFAFLITSTGIKSNTWYLLAVGGLGLLQNLLVAGAPRAPAALGFPLQLASMTCLDHNGERQQLPAVFGQEKVMWTLMQLEEKFKGYGKSLVGEFFPGKMRDWEKTWWELDDTHERNVLLLKAKHDFYKIK
ncbi:hypothetical protein F5Y14DRAFT_441559 [Nemania sp. NC0429]|nr:hypothetical protein F5Y14DRAFT_441559 [Nemania sp. NC0429]